MSALAEGSAQREMLHLICRDKIGSGIAREVYSSSVLPNYVVKIETGAQSFQNVTEWQTWLRVRGTQWEKWFAPCRWISASGVVLIMEKTVPCHDYPVRMPAFLCDFKRTNYGFFQNHIVCHDYGTNLLTEHGMTKRMRKVEWWDA